MAEAIRLVVNALLTDRELPVKVEAAIALQMFLNAQDKAQKYIEPEVGFQFVSQSCVFICFALLCY